MVDQHLITFNRLKLKGDNIVHDLPRAIINILMNFAPLFSRTVFLNICLLFKAHILSKGRRTITDMLRLLGLQDDRKFSKFHRIFYGAKWSGLQASQILFKLLYKLISSNEEILIAIDSTIERRRGAKIKGLGSMRDPIATTKSNKVLTIGLSWLVAAVVIKLPWASKNWALPFLTLLMPPKKPLKSSTNEKKDFHKHKTMTHWTCQIARALRRWAGKLQKITIVADSAFACFYIANACIDLSIGLISRLRKDARLYEFASAPTKKRGRPRILGQRHTSLENVAKDPNRKWTTLTVAWYGGKIKDVFVLTGTCLWYCPGKRPVPIKWVLVKTSEGSEWEAFFSTDLTHTITWIIESFVGRWPLETTFEESRRHLGIETQRQWSDKAIDRITPAIFASFSLINLIALKMQEEKDEEIPLRRTVWYKKQNITFSDILIYVKESLLRRKFNCHIKRRQEINLFEELVSLLAAA